MNAHMPEYVAEANAALESGEHSDAERLTGTGVRLQEGMEARNEPDEGASDFASGATADRQRLSALIATDALMFFAGSFIEQASPHRVV